MHWRPDWLPWLSRRVRACARLTRAVCEHKVRIKDPVRQLLPMTPLAGDLGKADRAVLERYAGPRALVAAGDTDGIAPETLVTVRIIEPLAGIVRLDNISAVRKERIGELGGRCDAVVMEAIGIALRAALDL